MSLWGRCRAPGRPVWWCRLGWLRRLVFGCLGRCSGRVGVVWGLWAAAVLLLWWLVVALWGFALAGAGLVGHVNISESLFAAAGSSLSAATTRCGHAGFSATSQRTTQ